MKTLSKTIMDKYSITQSDEIIGRCKEEGFPVFKMGKYPVFITAYDRTFQGRSKDIDLWYFYGPKSTLMINQTLIKAVDAGEEVAVNLLENEINRFLRYNNLQQ